MPALPAALGREIEQVPQRPDQIHVPRFLSRVGSRVQSLGVVEVVDATATPHEHVDRRQLRALLVLAVVAAVVWPRADGRQARRGAPRPARGGENSRSAAAEATPRRRPSATPPPMPAV